MKFGIIFGGVSYEHEISIVSAISLKKILHGELVFIFLDKNREFYFIPPNAMNSKIFSSGEYRSYPRLTLKNGGFYQKGFLFGENKIALDVAVNLVHGGDGEDGKLASLFRFFGVPAITPSIEASCISYNKHFTKMYAKEIGVDVLPYTVLKKGEKPAVQNYPIILKPLRLGSSIGVSAVKNSDELNYALDVAFEFDSEVMLEPFLSGVKEYNLAGCRCDDEFCFSIVEEPEKVELLDFDKKYLDFSRTQKVHKAEISNELESALKEAFKKIYGELFCGSLIRCDFFYHDGKIYLNEINPIPGSMANYLFDDFEAMLNKLAHNLPKERAIPIEYRYINTIQAAKGK